MTQVLPGSGRAAVPAAPGRPRSAAPAAVPAPIDVPAERSARRRRGLAVLTAYVALTKPRIVELLLVTTVPAMML
ncbi:MAG TPA: protoheme IX farnesyltransferase, partial [Mycobacteriales bacterium]|nr:protoheme IX farnesyltransferase [Mycobacteriales bacterium]